MMLTLNKHATRDDESTTTKKSSRGGMTMLLERNKSPFALSSRAQHSFSCNVTNSQQKVRVLSDNVAMMSDKTLCSNDPADDGSKVLQQAQEIFRSSLSLVVDPNATAALDDYFFGKCTTKPFGRCLVCCFVASHIHQSLINTHR